MRFFKRLKLVSDSQIPLARHRQNGAVRLDPGASIWREESLIGVRIARALCYITAGTGELPARAIAGPFGN